MMKIGYVQFSPVLGDLEATIARLEALLPQAADADLLVLPELCNSGYNFASREQAYETSEEAGNSKFLSFLADKCREIDLKIVTGFNERQGERLYNSAVLLGKQGVAGIYRKMHLFSKEKDFFHPGDTGLPVFRCGSAKIGMLVCFDWQFPEVWRILALKGADIICHSANLVLSGLAQRAVPVHALVNRVFVVTANRIGTESGLTFTGCSLIADPRGNILCEAPADQPAVGTVEVNHRLARDKAVTPRNHLFTDRRPEEYGFLVRRSE